MASQNVLTLALAALTIDPRLQSRVGGLNDQLVLEYLEAMAKLIAHALCVSWKLVQAVRQKMHAAVKNVKFVHPKTGNISTRPAKELLHDLEIQVMKSPPDDAQTQPTQAPAAASPPQETAAPIPVDVPAGSATASVEPAAPEAAAPDQPLRVKKDADGKHVPAFLRRAFTDPLHFEAPAQLEKWMRAAQSAASWSKWLRVHDLLQALATAQECLLEAQPKTLHWPCRGRGCELCQGAGYLPDYAVVRKWVAALAEEEHADIAASKGGEQRTQ
jgi:hypothetical protein